jgi:site-specific DNA-methyltransferase (adenine-specific)
MKLINNDCIEAMKAMPDNSVDSIVTDPPYELGFMGKSWDASGIAFNIEVWQQALRVLKPGGHLIAFSGSRTYHRMAVAIEDAGFQIRDQIMWVYGSGFPKSHNISKALDKDAGIWRGKAGQVTTSNGAMSGPNYERTAMEPPFTDEAKQWNGWGTALKPAHEPMVLARKPLEGTVANNVLTYGVGGLNIDATRVAHLSEADRASATPQGKVTSNKLAGSAPDTENAGRVDVERPDTSLGRFPANFIHDGSDEVLALFPITTSGAKKASDRQMSSNLIDGLKLDSVNNFEASSGSAARFFYCAKASKRDRNEGLDGFIGKEIGSKGNGLARTCATCGASVIDGCNCPDRTFVNPTRANHHPTVKPTDLMRYLCRLVTPPAGIVLDPFMGSGSTGKAAMLEGFDFIGIEQSAEYVEIAKARIAWAVGESE